MLALHAKRRNAEKLASDVTILGPRKSDHENEKYAFQVYQTNSYAVGSVDRKGRVPIEDQIVYSYAVEKVLFDPNFFDRAFPSAHPVEKVDFLNGMRRSDCSIEKFSKPTASLTTTHHRTTHTFTPYSSPGAGLTATMLLLLLPLLLLLLLTTTRRGTSCSPPASSA